MSIETALTELWNTTGAAGFSPRQVVMLVVGFLLIYLAIAKRFEPLLLLPIGFGGILANIPFVGIAEANGFIGRIYEFGVSTGVFPLFIFMGVGALTDFGPLLANRRTALLGAAAQFGIFATLLGALGLARIEGIDFSPADAAAIGIIGGADGPTAIFLAGKLSPQYLGSIAVAAYSYMALVPIIQPPIVRLLTSTAERRIRMEQLREVPRLERILFPLMVVTICAVLLPSATPLIGALMFGNLLRESKVTDRLAGAAQNELMNIVTIMLGLAVGSRLSGDTFFTVETVGILLLGLVAFSIGTASGVLLAKAMNRLGRRFGAGPINPIIGAAGVSAVPMAARVSARLGREADPDSHLIMHAMGPNVAGVIGSAVAAGIFLALVPV